MGCVPMPTVPGPPQNDHNTSNACVVVNVDDEILVQYPVQTVVPLPSRGDEATLENSVTESHIGFAALLLAVIVMVPAFVLGRI